MFRALVFALGAGLARTDGRVTSRSKSQPEKIPPLDRSLLPWLGAKNEYYRRINRTRVPSETLPNYSNENHDLKIATLCGLFDFGRENAERSINRVPGYYPGILIYLLTRLLAHPPRGNVGELVKRILIYCELEILRSLQIYRVG